MNILPTFFPGQIFTLAMNNTAPCKQAGISIFLFSQRKKWCVYSKKYCVQ